MGLSTASYSWWIRKRTWCSQGITPGVVSNLWQNAQKAIIMTVMRNGTKACTTEMYVRYAEKSRVSCIDGGEGDDKLMLCGRMPLRRRRS